MNQESRHTINLIQSPAAIETEPLKLMAIELLDQLCSGSVEVSLAFVDDTEMRRLNRTYRGIDTTTDVLSFPLHEKTGQDRIYLGDVAIATDTARKQALSLGHSLQTEISQLFAHGMIHLCGYDHETDDGEMHALETRLQQEIVERYCR